jgi:hypothetical protein
LLLSDTFFAELEQGVLSNDLPLFVDADAAIADAAVDAAIADAAYEAYDAQYEPLAQAIAEAKAKAIKAKEDARLQEEMAKLYRSVGILQPGEREAERLRAVQATQLATQLAQAEKDEFTQVVRDYLLRLSLKDLAENSDSQEHDSREARRGGENFVQWAITDGYQHRHLSMYKLHNIYKKTVTAAAKAAAKAATRRERRV